MPWKLEKNQPYLFNVAVPLPLYFVFTYLHRSIALTAFLFAFNLALIAKWVFPDTNLVLTILSFEFISFLVALPFLYGREKQDFERKIIADVNTD